VVGILAIVRYNSNDTGEDRGEELLDRNKMWRDRRVEGRSEEHKKAERVGLLGLGETRRRAKKAEVNYSKSAARSICK
jgi:hypothetical protein